MTDSLKLLSERITSTLLRNHSNINYDIKNGYIRQLDKTLSYISREDRLLLLASMEKYRHKNFAFLHALTNFRSIMDKFSKTDKISTVDNTTKWFTSSIKAIVSVMEELGNTEEKTEFKSNINKLIEENRVEEVQDILTVTSILNLYPDQYSVPSETLSKLNYLCSMKVATFELCLNNEDVLSSMSSPSLNYIKCIILDALLDHHQLKTMIINSIVCPCMDSSSSSSSTVNIIENIFSFDTLTTKMTEFVEFVRTKYQLCSLILYCLGLLLHKQNGVGEFVNNFKVWVKSQDGRDFPESKSSLLKMFFHKLGVTTGTKLLYQYYVIMAYFKTIDLTTVKLSSLNNDQERYMIEILSGDYASIDKLISSFSETSTTTTIGGGAIISRNHGIMKTVNENKDKIESMVKSLFPGTSTDEIMSFVADSTIFPLIYTYPPKTYFDIVSSSKRNMIKAEADIPLAWLQNELKNQHYKLPYDDNEELLQRTAKQIQILIGIYLFPVISNNYYTISDQYLVPNELQILRLVRDFRVGEMYEYLKSKKNIRIEEVFEGGGPSSIVSDGVTFCISMLSSFLPSQNSPPPNPTPTLTSAQKQQLDINRYKKMGRYNKDVYLFLKASNLSQYYDRKKYEINAYGYINPSIKSAIHKVMKNGNKADLVNYLNNEIYFGQYEFEKTIEKKEQKVKEIEKDIGMNENPIIKKGTEKGKAKVLFRQISLEVPFHKLDDLYKKYNYILSTTSSVEKLDEVFKTLERLISDNTSLRTDATFCDDNDETCLPTVLDKSVYIDSTLEALTERSGSKEIDDYITYCIKNNFDRIIERKELLIESKAKVDDIDFNNILKENLVGFDLLTRQIDDAVKKKANNDFMKSVEFIRNNSTINTSITKEAIDTFIPIKQVSTTDIIVEPTYVIPVNDTLLPIHEIPSISIPKQNVNNTIQATTIIKTNNITYNNNSEEVNKILTKILYNQNQYIQFTAIAIAVLAIGAFLYYSFKPKTIKELNEEAENETYRILNIIRENNCENEFNTFINACKVIPLLIRQGELNNNSYTVLAKELIKISVIGKNLNSIIELIKLLSINYDMYNIKSNPNPKIALSLDKTDENMCTIERVFKKMLKIGYLDKCEIITGCGSLWFLAYKLCSEETKQKDKITFLNFLTIPDDKYNDTKITVINEFCNIVDREGVSAKQIISDILKLNNPHSNINECTGTIPVSKLMYEHFKISRNKKYSDKYTI